MSAGNPDQKVYVYAVFSSLNYKRTIPSPQGASATERKELTGKQAEYCFESTVSEFYEKNSVSSLWHTTNRLRGTP